MSDPGKMPLNDFGVNLTRPFSLAGLARCVSWMGVLSLQYPALRLPAEALCCFLKQHQCSEGKTKPIFMCKCQSVSSQQSQPRLLPRPRARRRLNNLAARCHCAQGSQPSKVMTESAPQIPPIHFHYHLFTALESSQTKPKPSWGMEISRTVQTVS